MTGSERLWTNAGLRRGGGGRARRPGAVSAHGLSDEITLNEGISRICLISCTAVLPGGKKKNPTFLIIFIISHAAQSFGLPEYS